MMNSRERVLLALDHKEPDRKPIAPPSALFVEPFRKLCENLRMEIPQPLRLNFGMVNIEDVHRLFVKVFDFDFDRFVSLDLRENHRLFEYKYFKSPDGVLVDEYGCAWIDKGVGLPYCTHNPLGNVGKVADVEKYQKWPNPDDPSLILKNASKTAKKIAEETNYVTTISVPTFFHRYQWLRGFNQWLIDMKTNPELHKAIADRIYHINLVSTLRLLNEVGDYTDLFTLNDDMGTTVSPFMSVEDYGEFVKPYYKGLITRVKKEFPKIRAWYHCHGCVMKLVPDIIDSGVDVLNPVLPGDNMDPVRLKKGFGDRLGFDGGVDVEHIMPFGTVNEVREHAKKVIETLAPHGGYIFRVQMVSPVVPGENLHTIYKTALEDSNY